jgi:DNA-binding NarL/FixJ family response regulator
VAEAEEERVRLLVIDDDADLCEVLRVVSEHHPLVDLVGAANSPEAAVSLSREHSPDAILLDHHFLTAEPPELRDPGVPRRTMRGLSGLEAVEFLRAVAPNAVIAVYTGTKGLADSVENAGADMYLLKGADPRSALNEVAEHVRRHRGPGTQ